MWNVREEIVFLKQLTVTDIYEWRNRFIYHCGDNPSGLLLKYIMIRWWQYFSQWEIYTWNMLGTKKDFIETIWFKRELKEKKDIFVGEVVDNTFMVLIHFLVSWALTRDDVGTQMLGTFTDTTHCSYFTLDLNDGQFLIAMRCRCFFSSSDAMSMVLATSYHRNQCDYF